MPCYCSELSKLKQDLMQLEKINNAMPDAYDYFKTADDLVRDDLDNFYSQTMPYMFNVMQTPAICLNITEYEKSLAGDFKALADSAESALSQLNTKINNYTQWDEEHHRAEAEAAEQAKQAAAKKSYRR